MLRELFPDAEIWYCYSEGHVYTKIGKFWYDIRGVKFKVPDTCQPLDHRNSHRPHRWDNKMGEMRDKFNEQCYLAVNNLKKLFVKCQPDSRLVQDWEKQEFQDLQERDNQISDLINLEHTLLSDRKFFHHLELVNIDEAREMSKQGAERVCHSLLEAMDIIKKTAELGADFATEIKFCDEQTARYSVGVLVDLGFGVRDGHGDLSVIVEWY